MRSALKSAAFRTQVFLLLALPAASLLADASATALSPSASAQASTSTATSPTAAPAALSNTVAVAAPSPEALSSTAAAAPQALSSSAAAAAPQALSSSAAASPALSSDVSATASAAPVADTGTAADSSPAEPAAPLPDIQDNSAAAQAPESQAGSVQSDDESPFRWTNFLLGFLGGALLGGTYGLLDAPPDNARVRNQDILVYGGAAAIGLGTVAIFLGGTTPQPAKPPEAGLRRPIPEVVLALRF
ncbi:MAG TPA: hypothetical protein VK914_09470 [bacterium]|jgi:hypothetical protein|nr:hypothetical protein [bacterium]